MNFGLGLGLPRAPLGAAAGYNPVSALGADLLGYFDAARTDSMTQSGGLVAEWRCIKTGFAVTQGSDPAKPIYSATSFNGAPGLTFDGTDDVLSGASHPYPTGNTDCEVWLLCSQGSLVADASFRYPFAMGDATNTHRSILRITSASINRARGRIGTGAATVDLTDTKVDFSSRHLIRHTLASSASSLRTDGVLTGPSATTGATINTRFRFGSFINTTPGNFYNGQVAALLITNPLSGSKLTDLEAWLNARRRL